MIRVIKNLINFIVQKLIRYWFQYFISIIITLIFIWYACLYLIFYLFNLVWEKVENLFIFLPDLNYLLVFFIFVKGLYGLLTLEGSILELIISELTIIHCDMKEEGDNIEEEESKWRQHAEWLNYPKLLFFYSLYGGMDPNYTSFEESCPTAVYQLEKYLHDNLDDVSKFPVGILIPECHTMVYFYSQDHAVYVFFGSSRKEKVLWHQIISQQ